MKYQIDVESKIRGNERKIFNELTERSRVLLCIVGEGPIEAEDLADVDVEGVDSLCGDLLGKGLIEAHKTWVKENPSKSARRRGARTTSRRVWMWESTPRGRGVVVRVNNLINDEMDKW